MYCFSEPMKPQRPQDAPPAPQFSYRQPVRSSFVWWLRMVGIAVFVTILAVQLSRSQDLHLARFDVRWLGVCMLLTVAQLLLEAAVWQWLLWAQRIRHPYPKTFVASLASQYLGLVTPGHVGEFLAAGYISMNTGMTFGYALSSVVMKKTLFWIAILGFGVLGLPLLADVPFLQGMQQIASTSAIALVVLSAGAAIWVVSLRRLTRKWERLSPWQIEMTEFWSGMRHLYSLELIIPLALAAVAFSLLFVQLDAILRSLGLVLPFLLIVRIVALSRLAARLGPLSVVGLGTKDVAVILLLSQQGIRPAIGMTAVLLLLVGSYLVTLLLSGMCWRIKPLVIRRLEPSSS